MKLSFTISALALMIIFSAASCAQPKESSAGTGKVYAKLIEATSQRTIPGIRDAQIETIYRFVLLWQSNERAQEFYWQIAGTKYSCDVRGVYRIARTTVDGEWYQTKEIDLSSIKKGDTLELVPMTRGKSPQISFTPANSDNAIFFKTDKSNWLHVPVGNFIKRPDIVMH